MFPKERLQATVLSFGLMCLLAFMGTRVTRLDMPVSKRCAPQASGNPLSHRGWCMRPLLDLLRNQPLSNSTKGFFPMVV